MSLKYDFEWKRSQYNLNGFPNFFQQAGLRYSLMGITNSRTRNIHLLKIPEFFISYNKKEINNLIMIILLWWIRIAIMNHSFYAVLYITKKDKSYP